MSRARWKNTWPSAHLPLQGDGALEWPHQPQGSLHGGLLSTPSPSWELVPLALLPGVAAMASQRLSTAALLSLWPPLFVLWDFSHFFPYSHFSFSLKALLLSLGNSTVFQWADPGSLQNTPQEGQVCLQ